MQLSFRSSACQLSGDAKWHLILFAQYYETLAIYRRDIIVPFGFLSMLIQAAIFAWIYQTIFARSGQTRSRARPHMARSALYCHGASRRWPSPPRT